MQEVIMCGNYDTRAIKLLLIYGADACLPEVLFKKVSLEGNPFLSDGERTKMLDIRHLT